MPTPVQSKEIVVPIELKLTEEVFTKLSQAVGSEQISAPVSGLLIDFLKHFVQGGFVVTAADIERMTKTAGEPVSNSRKVMELVDKAAGRKEGAYEFRVQIDPNMIEHIREIAIARGLEMDQVVNEAWDSMMLLGWIFQVPDTCLQFTLSESQKAAVAKILGKDHFYGTDVFNALTTLTKKASK